MTKNEKVLFAGDGQFICMDERDMSGKRIENIEVNGNTVRIDLEDGTHFEFWASDGGYSYQNKTTRWK